MWRRPWPLVLLTSVLLQGCQTLGLESDHEGGGHRYASQGSNADCQRLAPYVVNSDGSLSRSDLTAGLKVEYKKWDTNGDGELSPAEAEPLNDHLRALNVNASPVLDWNGDGKITFEEFASGWGTMFDLCADDGGDVVTKADLQRSPVAPPPKKTDDDKPPEGASTPNPGGGY